MGEDDGLTRGDNYPRAPKKALGGGRGGSQHTVSGRETKRSCAPKKPLSATGRDVKGRERKPGVEEGVTGGEKPFGRV